MSNFSQNLPTEFDVIVVGAGAAGLYAALCLPESLQVGLISKDPLKTGASDWAQGGIAAAIDPADSPLLHLEDTMRAGAGLCDSEAVEALVEQAPACIQSLVDMGVAFDRQEGRLAMTLEAAHSRPRVLHAADTTGRALVGRLTEQVLQRQNITVLAQAFALSLWINELGHCQGVSLLYQGQIRWVQGKAVVLATGGGGQVFAQTTNPMVSTGDGVAMAWRVGGIVRDLEFFQFHPTALTKVGAPRFLISEAVRGEGAHLVDSSGYRFAFEYHPDGELAPRDVVSRAIFNHLQKTAENPADAHVYLDLRPIPAETIRYRFPNIIQVCQTWGIDVLSQPIPVAPAAHYWMGGVEVDLMNRTSIPGLYAIGETASTGVHGANRLASNSLLECLVYAAQLSNIEGDLKARGEFPAVPNLETLAWAALEIPQERLLRLRDELQRLMWQSAGICRRNAVLEEAIAQVASWREEVAALPVTQCILQVSPSYHVQLKSPNLEGQLRSCAETLNLLDIAYLILKSAAFRTESRGGHYRTDYPQTSTSWQVHTLIQQEQWRKEPLK